MKKMTNRNIIQRGTETTGLSDKIGRWSLEDQHGGLDQHPANVGCSNFGYTNNDRRDYSTQIHRRKKWIQKVNKNVFHCYLQKNPKQRGYRKE